MAYLSHVGQSANVSAAEKLDFVVSMTNLTWPAVTAIASGFTTLTGVGMRTAQQLNANFTQTQGAILGAGGVAALVLYDMTSKAMEFNREMALVKGLIGDISNREMAQLSAAAKKVAVDFGEAPSEIARGLQMVARAGIANSADQIRVLTNGMRLAKVEGMEVADAVTEVITATTLFGDSYANVERYTSAIAHAANVSVTSAREIGEALKYVGGGAKEHWTPEDTLGAIATLSQKGVQGSTAGIAIRSFMNYLLREMPKSKKALDELGMTFDDFWIKTAAGQKLRLKPLQDIIMMITEASQGKGMGRGDLMRVLAQFGEPRQMQQYIKLFPTAEELQNGTWLLSQFNSEMKNTYDMQARLQTVLSSSQEKWNQMMSGLQVMEISIAEGLLPTMGTLSDTVKGVSMAIANNKILAGGLAAALSTLALAAGILVLAWGKGAVGYLFAEATNKVKNAVLGLTGSLTRVNRVSKESPFLAMSKQMQTLERQTKSLDGLFAKTIFGEYKAPAKTGKILGKYGMTMTPALEKEMYKGILARRGIMEEKGIITKGLALEDSYANAKIFLKKADTGSEVYQMNEKIQKRQRQLGSLAREQEDLTKRHYMPGRMAMETARVQTPESPFVLAEKHRGDMMKAFGLTSKTGDQLGKMVEDVTAEQMAQMDKGAIKGIKAYREAMAANPDYLNETDKVLQKYLPSIGKYHKNNALIKEYERGLAAKEIEFKNLSDIVGKDIRSRDYSKLSRGDIAKQQKKLEEFALNMQARGVGLKKIQEDQGLGAGLLSYKTMGDRQTYLKKIKGLGEEEYQKLMAIPVSAEADTMRGMVDQVIKPSLQQTELAGDTAIKLMEENAQAVARGEQFKVTFRDRINDFLGRWGTIGDKIPKSKDWKLSNLTTQLSNIYGKTLNSQIKSFDDIFKPISMDIFSRIGKTATTGFSAKVSMANKAFNRAKISIDKLKSNSKDLNKTIKIAADNQIALEKQINELVTGGKTPAGVITTKTGAVNALKNQIANRQSAMKKKEQQFTSKNITGSQEFLDQYRRQMQFKEDKVEFVKDLQANREAFYTSLSETTEPGNIRAMAEAQVNKFIANKRASWQDTEKTRYKAQLKEIDEREKAYKTSVANEKNTKLKKENLEIQAANFAHQRRLVDERFQDKISRGPITDKNKMVEAVMRSMSKNRQSMGELERENIAEFVRGTDFEDIYPGYDKKTGKQKPPVYYKSLSDALAAAEKERDDYEAKYDDTTKGAGRRLQNRLILNRKLANDQKSVTAIKEKIADHEKAISLATLQQKNINTQKAALELQLADNKISQVTYAAQKNALNKQLVDARRTLRGAKADQNRLQREMERMTKDAKFTDLPKLFNNWFKAKYDAVINSEKIQDTFGKRLPEGTLAKVKPNFDKLEKTLTGFFKNIESGINKTIQTVTGGAQGAVGRVGGIRRFLYGATVTAPGGASIVMPGVLGRMRGRMGGYRDTFFDTLMSKEKAATAKQFASFGFLQDFKKNLMPNIPLLGSLSGALGVSVGAIPIFGAVILAAGIAIAGLLMWWTRWNNQMEIATQKLEKYKKTANNLEQQEDSVLKKRQGMKPGTPEYKDMTNELGKVRGDLSVVYDRMAGQNKEIFKLRSENFAQYSPIIRKELGPSWYQGNILDQATKALNPASWASGEMFSRMTGAEQPTKNQWMTGPREQMLAEAFTVESQRTKRIQALNASQEGQMAMLDKQRAKGTITQDMYNKQREKAFTEYAEKRNKLTREYDRQLAPIVGPANVEATKKLYQVEEEAKTHRMLLANAAFKLIGAIFALIGAITLPFRLLFGGGGGVYAPTAEEGQQPGAENISQSMEGMVNEMQNSISKIDEVKTAINNMANGILYEMYKANYTIDLIRGLFDYVLHPGKWANPNIKAPRMDAESYEAWVAKNKLGLEHRAPYYPTGETSALDEAKKAKMASGEISPGSLLVAGEITPEEAQKIFDKQKAKKDKALKEYDTTLGIASPESKGGEEVKSFWSNLPIIGGLFAPPEPGATVAGAGLPPQMVGTAIGQSGPERNETIGAAQLVGQVGQKPEEQPGAAPPAGEQLPPGTTPTGVKPSEAASQIGSAATMGASMYLPIGTTDIAGVAAGRMTGKGNIPAGMTETPGITPPPEMPPEGEVGGVPPETGAGSKPPGPTTGRFAQKEKKETLQETWAKIMAKTNAILISIKEKLFPAKEEETLQKQIEKAKAEQKSGPDILKWALALILGGGVFAYLLGKFGGGLGGMLGGIGSKLGLTGEGGLFGALGKTKIGQWLGDKTIGKLKRFGGLFGAGEGGLAGELGKTKMWEAFKGLFSGINIKGFNLGAIGTDLKGLVPLFRPILGALKDTSVLFKGLGSLLMKTLAGGGEAGNIIGGVGNAIGAIGGLGGLKSLGGKFIGRLGGLGGGIVEGAGGLFAEGGALAGAGGLFAEGGALAGVGGALGGVGGAIGGALGIEGGLTGALAAFGIADIWNPLGWAALLGAGALTVGGLLSTMIGGQKEQTGVIQDQGTKNREHREKFSEYGALAGGMRAMWAFTPFGIAERGWDMLSGSMMGENYRFKKHSPFTVWKGQSGTLPGGSSGAFSVRFPELDSEKFKQAAIEAGQAVGGNNGTPSIILQEGAVQITSSDPEEIEQVIINALVNASRKMGGS